MEKNGIRKLAAIMFTDIEGYTSLVSENEEQAMQFVRKHREALTTHTNAHRGEVIEFYGDGSLSIYSSAVDAVECAIEMQKIYREKAIIPVRIGIHLGDVVMRDGSVFGDGVNVASRIESMGVAGNILISEQVAHELKNKEHIKIKSFGRFNFKNVEHSIELFAVEHPMVVMPNKKQLKGPKGKPVNRKILPVLVAALVILLTTIFYFVWKSNKTSMPEVVEEKISVPPFKNFTGNPSLDYIGEMAAHSLTKELAKTANANVLAFQTNGEIQQMFPSSSGDEVNRYFAKEIGALNILEGSYNQKSTDTLDLSAFISQTKDGQVRHTFESVFFPSSKPLVGIDMLASDVKGFWDAKDEKLLSFPSFESYKFYMNARNEYYNNDSLALAYLRMSIQADSSFLDSYFLMIGYFHNHQEYDTIQRILNVLKPLIANSSPYEKNIVEIERADLAGDNVKAYNIAMMDLKSYERDFFTLTDYLIISNTYVNAPQKAVDIFIDKSLNKLNLADCAYCRTSHLLAAIAYIRLQQFEKAKQILDDFPAHQKTRRYYSYYIKLLSRMGAFGELNELIKNGKEHLPKTNDNAVFLDYIATRELHNAGHKQQSKVYARKTIDQSTDNKTLLAWAHYFLDDLSNALKEFQNQLDQKDPNHRILSQVGVIHAKNGNKDDALKAIERLADVKRPYDYGSVPYHQARIYLHLGDKDLSLKLLQQAVNEGARFYPNNYFDQDPDFQELVDDPQFQRITHPLGLTKAK